MVSRAPRHPQDRRVHGGDDEVTRESGVAVSEPDQVHHSLDDGAPGRTLDLRGGVVVPIDRASLAGFGHRSIVVLACE